jgi:hypothetical protein
MYLSSLRLLITLFLSVIKLEPQTLKKVFNNQQIRILLKFPV